MIVKKCAAVLLFLSIPSVLARNGKLRRDEEPKYTHSPDATPYCTWWYDNDGSIACKDIPASWSITLADFRRWNPSITETCGNFLKDTSYCVEAFNEPTQTSSSPPAATTTAAGPPGPTQPGQHKDCNRWDQINAGDSCPTFINKYPGLTLKDLITFNTGIGEQCENLWAGYYICTGIAGWAPATTTKTMPATPTATNGITTPTPVQPRIVDNCDSFHKVEPGDGCAAITSKYHISLAQFTKWNPGVGKNCESIWLGYYVCVSVLGDTPSSTPTPTPTTTTSPTKPTNGVSTPTPVRPGITNNCETFHEVVSGDYCAAIAQKYSISLSQFNNWNPDVKADCSGLWAGYYVCVKVIGSNPTPTTLQTTTTTKGNGVVTPTPTQPGMINNCKSFYKVASGDSCASIVSKAKISLGKFYSWNQEVGKNCENLWLGYQVCIGVI